MKTNNEASCNYSTENPLVEFFSKAGSLFVTGSGKRQSYYGNEATALDLFKNAWCVSPETAMKLLFWVRDPRGGAGNRSGFRSIVSWLTETNFDWISSNLELIPVYGRWDDLIACVGTKLESQAIELWANAIRAGDGLASKWAPRENKANANVAKLLRRALSVSSKEYRKTVVSNTSVVETNLCNNDLGSINYSGVPSVAMSRYNKVFSRKDTDRFVKYLEDVKNPNSKEKINASVVFPHDLVRSILIGRDKTADAQFEAMPNWFSTNMRVMPIVDSSGSMGVRVAGLISAYDVAAGLAFYASDRLGAENPFYRKFIPFSDEAKFFNWTGCNGLSEGLLNYRRCTDHGFVGSTNIYSAFKLMLDTASFMNITPDQMPNAFLIISDMQFNGQVVGDDTLMKNIISQWVAAGYEVPKIVYWNIAGYAGAPATVYDVETGLVSGFSPSILKAVFEGDDFTPLGIMKRAIEKYEVKVP